MVAHFCGTLLTYIWVYCFFLGGGVCFASQWECCGAFGADDWNLNIYFNCTDSNPSREKCGVPFSCCTKDPAVCPPAEHTTLEFSSFTANKLPFTVKHRPTGVTWSFTKVKYKLKRTFWTCCNLYSSGSKEETVKVLPATHSLVICVLQKAGWSCQLSWLSSNRTSRPWCLDSASTAKSRGGREGLSWPRFFFFFGRKLLLSVQSSDSSLFEQNSLASL